MKKLKDIKLYAFLLVFLVLFGCGDHYTIQTILFPDGSCKRIITVKAKGSEITPDTFPIPIDSTWTITTTNIQPTKDAKGNALSPTQKENSLIRAEKSFHNIKAMNREFSFNINQTGESKTTRFTTLDKKFKWFFTFYTYRETCKHHFPFKKIPLTDYFNEEELKILKDLLFENDRSEEIYSKELQDNIEGKFEKWFARVIFDEFFRILIKVNPNDTLSINDLESKKETLFKQMIEKNIINIDDNLSLAKIVEFTADFFKIPKLKSLESEFNIIQTKFEELEGSFFDKYTNEIQLPGLVIDTNAPVILGNQIEWEVALFGCTFLDYEMWAESRKVNIWAFILSAMVVFAIITLLFIALLKKNSANKE